MKKAILSLVCVGAMTLSAFAQLQDEKTVTITMDLQPILQLKLEGPDQIDFTFDEISEYYGGITKYGANVLKVSASVNFDLWAAGISNGSVGAFLWDNPVSYAVAAGGAAITAIPMTALELRQFPANPAIAATCATNTTASGNYSVAFQPAASVATGNNSLYTPPLATPYTSPTSTAVLASSEKYIAGGTLLTAGCFVAGGSYLLQAALGTSSYYYVIDYRILPGLPVVFPFHNGDAADPAGQVVNNTAPYIDAADGAPLNTLGDAASTSYARPGVYTMAVKYILAQDQ